MRNRINVIPYILTACWLWLLSPGLSAIEVADLYEAELPVTSQGQDERSKVIRAALTEVIIKVSGNGRVALSPGIPELLGQSSQFLQQYRYRTKNLPPDPATGLPVTEQYLWVRFDQVSLDQAMRNIQVPVWGRSRPLTLAWLVVEQKGARQVLGSSEESALTDAVKRIATRRGIPLDLPLFDLEDRARIKATDILGGFQGVILEASKRYSPDAVLVGRLRDMGGQRWEARWTLNLGGRDYNWSEQGNFEEVIGFGIDGTANTLAGQFVTAPDGGSGELSVLVLDVFNLDDYARSEQFLAGLDGVIELYPGRIEKKQILYKLKIRGNRDSLVQAVRLGNQRVLELVPTPPQLLQPVTVNTPVVAAPVTPVPTPGETSPGAIATPQAVVTEPVVPVPVQPVVTTPDIVFRLLP